MSGYRSKQMIVVRRDLKMRKGKIAAQASHACVEAILMALAREGRGADIQIVGDYGWVDLAGGARGAVPTPLEAWFEAGVAKICVYVDSEEELLEVAAQVRAAGHIAAVVRDAGLTEFHGEATITAMATEPLYPEQIDPITGSLPLF